MLAWRLTSGDLTTSEGAKLRSIHSTLNFQLVTSNNWLQQLDNGRRCVPPLDNNPSLILTCFFRYLTAEQDEIIYEEVPDSPQPHVIETGDSVKVKQVLDDATTETLIENGFQPNYFWENLKLFLMFLSCVFAMIAQFYPIPFPDSRPLLGFCCAMYFILSTVLQGMITYIDKDIIMIGKADPVRHLCWMYSHEMN